MWFSNLPRYRVLIFLVASIMVFGGLLNKLHHHNHGDDGNNQPEGAPPLPPPVATTGYQPGYRSVLYFCK